MRNRVEQGIETLSGFLGQLRNLLDEFGGGLAQRAGNDSEEDQQADGCGQRRGKVQAAAHPGDEGFEKHRHRQRDRDRHDDDRQARDAPQHSQDQAGDDEGTPRDRRGHTEGTRDGSCHVALILVFFAHRHHDGSGCGLICALRRQGS